MERYCYKVYKRDDFLPECNFKYWKIDIRRVMCEVYNTDNDSEKKQYNIFDETNENQDINEKKLEYDKATFRDRYFIFVKSIERVLLSNECELDLLNDLYLILVNASEKKEKLFLDAWQEPEKQQVREDVKNTINNYKKKNRVWDLIFDMSELQTTKKGVEITSLGSGIQRLWLSSSRFRKLFSVTETDFSKYYIKNIIDILWEGEKKGIVYKIDDYIILEKLLGLNIAEYFQKYALKYFEENEENDLLKIILKCFGNFNQCRILMIVVNRFEELMRCYHVVDQKHVRNVYIALLDDLIQEHNKRYTKVLDIILNDLTKNTDIDDCIKTIELQRKEIAEERIWDFCLNKTEENKRLARYFASTSDKDDIMNILTKCRKRFGRADECFQYLVHSVHENGIRESAISYDIECRKKIQRNVILENYNRYMK